MLNHFKSKTLIALIVAGLSLSAVAEEKDTGKKDDEDKKETLVEALEKKTEFGGFIDVYQDEKDGTGLVVFDESQLDMPFMYFASTVDGVVSAGAFRGQFRGSGLIEFRRNFDRI